MTHFDAIALPVGVAVPVPFGMPPPMTDQAVEVFGDAPSVVTGARSEHCDFWLSRNR